MQPVFPSLLEADFGPWWPVAGSAAAHAAVLSATPLVCVYGPPGAGKSHLLALAKGAQGGAGAQVWDDLEALPQDAQTELFYALQRLAQGGRIITASRLPVAQITTLKPDIKSRLLLGLQAELDLPTEPELRALLAHWAAGRQLRLPGAVADYVLARASRSPATLKALLLQLDALSLEQKRAITVPLAREVLEG
jgi:DnaA family protein